MGYGDYVISDDVVSKVYYVEGLGHNLFSARQFCNSDLEIAFRKHSCYVRDVDGVELLKGCRGSNLYTIFVEDMMKSSPICLLSKASKNKSWLWHRLVPNPVPAAPYVPQTNKDLEILFQPMFDEYLEPPSVEIQVPSAPAAQVLVNSVATPSSTTIDQDAPSTSYSLSSSEVQASISHQGVAVRPTIEDNLFAQAEDDPFINVFAPEPKSKESSSGDVSSAESHQVIQPHDHLKKWTKDHPIDNVIGNPSRPVSTRKQLATDALWCFYHSILSKVEPKNFKTASMEDEEVSLLDGVFEGAFGALGDGG
uniref:Integrase, catalytic region, zinc finger, CCHC-type, peptidase aspartic, catalytic n=1 Tax=Tanacetum cinerariifolium TaxID=118510 RepID=A0A6L2MET6_TANCI|nr:integrase, catalytic region, zinc finger, CCHC-type, peptidase aspartic, catalytic [Tanacetum cinerariifolium]